MKCVVLATMTAIGCAAVNRTPPKEYPDGCGSHVECYNKSLINLDEAYKALAAAQASGQTSALLLSPPGTVAAFAGSKEPPGWLFCNGRVLDKNDARYKPLFDAIGTSYGGDANPNFQIPDYRGVFLRGLDGGTGRDPDIASRTAMGLNGTGNSAAGIGSYQPDSVGTHTHEIRGVHLEAQGGKGFNGRGLETNSSPPSPRNFDNVQPHRGAESRPKNVTVNYMIKM